MKYDISFQTFIFPRVNKHVLCVIRNLNIIYFQPDWNYNQYVNVLYIRMIITQLCKMFILSHFTHNIFKKVNFVEFVSPTIITKKNAKTSDLSIFISKMSQTHYYYYFNLYNLLLTIRSYFNKPKTGFAFNDSLTHT